jgi:hypothetical protein
MNQFDKTWNMQYEKLVELKRTTGHCLVPRSYEQDKSLGIWVGTQRSTYNAYTIRPDRKERLEEIGFAWRADTAHRFKPDDCMMPQSYEQDESLGISVRTQRCINVTNKLRLDPKRLLEDIGFGAMNQFDKTWNMQYEKLVELKRTTGHCLVPRSYEQDKSLGIWVSTQRTVHVINNQMRLDRKGLLDEIGFAWRDTMGTKLDDKKWNKQYEKLLNFKQNNGHCMVPRSYSEDKSLGIWVSTQRSTHNTNKMRLDRIALLNEIEFAWKADNYNSFKSDDKRWHEQYEKVVKFKRKNGHCMVPHEYEQDKTLGLWVSTQRKNHKTNKMRLDRKRILDEIGFASTAHTLAAPSSPMNVRGLIVIGSFHSLGSSYFSLLSFFCSLLCRIRIRKRSPAVGVSQMKHY